MEERIHVVLIEVGEQPKLVEVENKLENFQELVGGYIEQIHFGKELSNAGIYVMVDEDALSKNRLPSAIMINEEHTLLLHGSVVLAGVKGEDFGGLTEDQILKLSNDIRYGEIEVDIKQDDEIIGTVDITTIVA